MSSARSRSGRALASGYASDEDQAPRVPRNVQTGPDAINAGTPLNVSTPGHGPLHHVHYSLAGPRVVMTAFERHRQLIQSYFSFFGDRLKLPEQKGVTDAELLQQEHRFIRHEEDDKDLAASHNQGKRMAYKYYQKLFKEYCIADLSRYREGKVGLRWRTQAEVVSGKGQFICGNKACDHKDNLRSFELHFAYVEDGKRKDALVKVRVCEPCAYKVNYRKIKQIEAQEKAERRLQRSMRAALRKQAKKQKKKRRSSSRRDSDASSGSSSDDDDDDDDNGDARGGRDLDDMPALQRVEDDRVNQHVVHTAAATVSSDAHHRDRDSDRHKQQRDRDSASSSRSSRSDLRRARILDSLAVRPPGSHAAAAAAASDSAGPSVHISDPGAAQRVPSGAGAAVAGGGDEPRQAGSADQQDFDAYTRGLFL